ncbi:hypothetical protein Acr_00g0099320 [Actinidia rufa]|uniref:Uncharacterized protein n=1 Tax=Actinidia rufa TaxID=165716 RepID=A0A7J0E1X4_9ERIC|nr:hypothetical protein Acr_00g0099320 [Actinidia rufa]
MPFTSSMGSHIAYPELINLTCFLEDGMNLTLHLHQVSYSHDAISIWHSPLVAPQSLATGFLIWLSDDYTVIFLYVCKFYTYKRPITIL